jgi:NAD(P)H-hydrate epimerase
MKVLTAAQMRETDRKTIEDVGIPGIVLMENAGTRVVEALLEKFPQPASKRIVIVAGKGNNGGDGFVVARHLANRGASPKVLLLAALDEVKGDAGINLGIALKSNISIVEISSFREWDQFKRELRGADAVVDAVLGTGLVKPLDGLYAEVAEEINRSGAFIVAVDIPSGLSSDSFEIIGSCVRADLTVTLGAPKIAHVFPPAEDFMGVLVVAPIGIPSFLFDDPGLKLELVEKKSLTRFFQARKKDTHKGTYGHLLVVSGSLGKTGAAVMAAKSALKMGAGLVTVATPESCLPLVARPMDELMTEPLEETPVKTISKKALPRVLELLEGKDALLLGPGISAHPSTAEFVFSLLPRVRIPTVIDADGLNIIAGRPEVLKSLQGPAVLTPHPGEFARLTGRSTADVLAGRLELVPAFAAEHNVYLVLKGYKTLIASPEGRVLINPTGNPGMATGGSGDVLSGMIASEIAQDHDVLWGTAGAVYVHGLAGDFAAERLSEKFLTAGDIIKNLPRALRAMAGG